MIKKLMGLFGYKVFSKAEYDQLTDSVVSCGVYYMSLVDNDNTYHHWQRCVTVPISELSNICLVENCIWEDVKDKILKQRSENDPTITSNQQIPQHVCSCEGVKRISNATQAPSR